MILNLWLLSLIKMFFSNKKNIIVCIFYRSPSSSLKLFNEKLDNIFDIVHKEKKYCYIIGDFNVNCIKDFSNVTVHSHNLTICSDYIIT